MLNRVVVEKVLEDAGWRASRNAPHSVLDYQRIRPHNRIILWPGDFVTLTVKRLEYLMKTPPTERTYPWQQKL